VKPDRDELEAIAIVRTRTLMNSVMTGVKKVEKLKTILWRKLQRSCEEPAFTQRIIDSGVQLLIVLNNQSLIT
jgi:hypothetical protein